MTSATRQQWSRALNVLGLAESASDEEIARAWRGLVRKTHPDLTGDPSPDMVDRLRDIMWAHRVLTRTPPATTVPPVRVTPTMKPHRVTHEPPIVAGPTRIAPQRGRATRPRQGELG